jgi:hypothetical protein
MLTDINLISLHQYHKELQREAEMARLANEAQPAQPALHLRALAAFGRQLESWGEQLQERFGDVEPLPAEIQLETKTGNF